MKSKLKFKFISALCLLVFVGCSKIDKSFDDLDKTRSEVTASNENMREMIDLTRFAESCEGAVDPHVDLASRQLKMQSCILGAPLIQTNENNVEKDWIYELIGASGSVLKLASAPVLVPVFKFDVNQPEASGELTGYKDEQHRIVTYVRAGFADERALPGGIGYDLFYISYAAALKLVDKFYYQAPVFHALSAEEQNYRRKAAMKVLYVAPSVLGAVWSQRGLVTNGPSVVKIKETEKIIPMQLVEPGLRQLMKERLRKIHTDYHLDDPALKNSISMDTYNAFVLEPRMGNLPSRPGEPAVNEIPILGAHAPMMSAPAKPPAK